MRNTISIVLFILLNTVLNAQGVHFSARADIEYGLVRRDFVPGLKDPFFSPGGGVALESGLQVGLSDELNIYANTGYAISFLGAPKFGNFSRINFTGGINYEIPVRINILSAIQAGGGVNYVIPGNYVEYDDTYDHKNISYHPAVGFEAEVLLISEESQVTVAPGFRFRYNTFTAERVETGSITDLPADLRELNTMGIDFCLVFIL